MPSWLHSCNADVDFMMLAATSDITVYSLFGNSDSPLGEGSYEKQNLKK